MPKPDLKPDLERLCSEMIETFLAGHHQWRIDLPYPQSHSDMKGGMMAVLKMFDVKRRPIALSDKEMEA